MSRLWKRRVSKEMFVIGWALIICGLAQGAVGVYFLYLAAKATFS